jgi:predicted  nucleic acid-binding Zn-ribbon protein
MTKPEDLYRLQQVESELAETRRNLNKVQAELEDSGAVQHARAGLEQAEETLQVGSGQQRNLELELKSLSEKARTAEQRLYSGVVTNPKELADLQAEVAALGRRRQSLEENVLEAMILRDEAEKAVSGAASRLEATEREWSVGQEDLSSERDRISAELAELEREQKDLLPRIDEDDLAAFRALWDRKGGFAVARVEAGACSGCGVAIAPSLEWQLRQGKVANCNNCDRMLVRL